MTVDLYPVPDEPAEIGARPVALADPDAERAVIGAALLGGDRIIDRANLAGHHFADVRNGWVWDALTRLRDEGSAIDPVTVANALHAEGLLTRINGAGYLHDCLAACTSPETVGTYAAIVRDRAVRRIVREVGSRVSEAAVTPADDPLSVVDGARDELDRVADRVAGVGPVVDMSTAFDAALDAIETGAQNTPTPWYELNDRIGGFRPGCLYVVAARPGEGKSIFGLNVARHIATAGRTVYVPSLEMTRQECTTRLIADAASVDLGRLVRGGRALTEDDWSRIARCREEVADLPIVVDDRAGMTLADIRAGARQARRSTLPLGAIVVDYLQLIASRERAESRQVEVATQTRHLKMLAKEMGVPIVLLAQLNRQVEGRADRLPRLSDLRESGAIEQDADVVILQSRDPNNADALNVAVAKNRHGPTGAFALYWVGQHARLANLSRPGQGR